MNTTKTCSICGKTKILNEFYKQKKGKYNRKVECKVCNKKRSKLYQQEHREERAKYGKKYRQEHKDEIRQREGKISMFKNKSSAQYLGIVIGERLIRHLFKDVVVMPYGFPDYDFVCNKGKKINVKTGCLNKIKLPYWHFFINHNKIADFFILVAFDNRTDLNLLHLWMIPGKEINHRSSKSISPSTIYKWDEWKMDVNDAQLCCTEMKNLS